MGRTQVSRGAEPETPTLRHACGRWAGRPQGWTRTGPFRLRLRPSHNAESSKLSHNLRRATSPGLSEALDYKVPQQFFAGSSQYVVKLKTG